MSLKIFYASAILFMVSFMAFSQSRQISGTILTEGEEEPLPGVNVYVKGTSIGTITDLGGNYNLEVTEGSETMVFSYLGYLTEEVPIGSVDRMDIKMKEDATGLDEVIITGYSYQKKKDIVGSIASLDASDVEGISINGLDQALQGKVAGVQVNQSSGTPGGGIVVRVRGATSIGASNRPLFVIDGVPVSQGSLSQRGFGGQNDNALSTINPNDIESYQILKDASAKAIYGAAGSNGVVIITTKRGKSEKPSFGFSASRGIISLTNKVELLNAEQLLELQREAVVNAGQDPDELGLIRGVTDQVDTDWLDEILRQAIAEEYQISANQRSGNTSYYASLGYRREEGVQLNNQFERLSVSLNVDQKATDKLTFGNNLIISRSVNDRVKGDNFLDGVYSGAVKSLPYHFPFDEFGRIVGPGNPAYAGFPNFNPVGQAVLPRFETITFKLLGGVYLEYEISDKIRAKTKLSIDYSDVLEDQFEPSNTAIGGFLETVGFQGLGVNSNSIQRRYVNTNTLAFSDQLGSDHKIDALIGAEFQDFTTEFSFVQGRLFPSDDFTYIESAGIVDAGSSIKEKRGRNSYFGELKYTYKDRYYFSGIIRADGSSTFGPNNRFGYFPGVAFGWRITREPFFEGISVFDDLKLRTGFGLTGNDRFPSFSFLETYTAATYSGNSGTSAASLGNPDLKWESTLEINLGVDISLLYGRMQVTFDYYDNSTFDLLFTEAIPFTTGFSGFRGNIGDISNKGFELAINSINLDGDVKWSTNINLSRNVALVESLVDTTDLLRGYDASGADRTHNNRIGAPVGAFWGLEFVGVDPATGDALYRDRDLDGEITEDDATFIGNPQPDLIGGITNNISWRNFDLSVFFQFSYGNDLINFSNGSLLNSGEDINSNQVVKALDRWQQPGDFTDVPKYEFENARNNWHSSRSVEDASFIRLKNVSLGYTIPERYLEKFNISSVRVFFSGTNLWTLTDYSGGDPEVSSLDGSTLAQGIDFFTLPQVRTMTVGLNVNF